MFNNYQLQEIETGKQHGVDVDIYSTPCYDAKQMWVIRKGLEFNIPILYLNPIIPWNIMYEIFKLTVFYNDIDTLQQKIQNLFIE